MGPPYPIRELARRLKEVPSHPCEKSLCHRPELIDGEVQHSAKRSNVARDDDDAGSGSVEERVGAS